MNSRLYQSYWRLALYYCYIFILNAKECNTSTGGEEQEKQGEQAQEPQQEHQQPQVQSPHRADLEEWVVRLEGGPEIASLLALRSGYVHIGPVLGFKDTYLWRTANGTRYKKRGLAYALNKLTDRAKIVWADQQKPVIRHKREYYGISEAYESSPDSDVDFRLDLDLPPKVESAGEKPEVAFNDELWDQEWYLQDRGRNSGDTTQHRLDLNVLPVYQLGITGRGVRVAVLDDGLEYTHDDLLANYDSEISYDITDRDDDPIPRYGEPDGNGHGTRCAGEIAMVADNGKCGVGVAFEARVGGIKMLDGVVNDRVEAEALSYRSDLVDIYTASWGPPDDGRSLDAPGRLASEALKKGVTEGRGGRGSIYVWASGNGGSKSDDCGCDGYVGSIYTIAIGSASQTGTFPWYGEICPATLATTYSSGAHQDQMIATTDIKNTCTTSHTGTSASAPLAAGILALALQVNKDLTWRDIQHLIVYTSNHSPLRVNPGWFKNAVGFWFNPRFGFGLMNAYALVTASSNWTSVPEKTICQVPPASLHRQINYGVLRRIEFETNGCAGTNNEVNYLEHVQVEITIEYSLRGALRMHLTSPSGTIVQILGTRATDNSNEGFVNWKFMSVATWGENPKGTWILSIRDEVGPMNNTGMIGNSKLILHGTQQRPHYFNKVLYDYDDSPSEENDKLNYIVDGKKDSLTEAESYEKRDNVNQTLRRNYFFLIKNLLKIY